MIDPALISAQVARRTLPKKIVTAEQHVKDLKAKMDFFQGIEVGTVIRQMDEHTDELYQQLQLVAERLEEASA